MLYETLYKSDINSHMNSYRNSYINSFTPWNFRCWPEHRIIPWNF